MSIQTIATKLGITLSDMQQAATKAILQTNDDILLLSPTGSGKTLAYLLPLSQLIEADSPQPQAIVLLPGRELAEQSLTVFRSMGTGLRAYACHGGRPTMDEHLEMRKLQPQVIFATPGRMLDHLEKQNIPTESIKYLVIDEFDKCLQMGFEKEMSAILDLIPKQVRHIFLSATQPSDDNSNLISLDHFHTLDYRTKEEGERVATFVVQSQEKDKLGTLARLLRSLNTHSTVVFLNYRDSVERTAAYLAEEGFSVAAYHGGLDQREREEQLYKFANHSACILVSTDLGSRGLDIPDVENIIHYHLPETEDNYIHRIGRTARWNRSGRAFFLLNAEERLPAYAGKDIEPYLIPDELPTPLPPLMATLYIGKGKKNKISKGDIVGFLCKEGGLTSKNIGRIDVYEYYSLVAVDRILAAKTIKKLSGKKIKGQKTVIEAKR